MFFWWVHRRRVCQLVGAVQCTSAGETGSLHVTLRAICCCSSPHPMPSPSAPSAGRPLVLVCQGDALLLDRRGVQLPGGCPIPSIGALLVTNSAQAFPGADALLDVNTSGHDRFGFRLEWVGGGRVGEPARLELHNISRWVGRCSGGAPPAHPGAAR